MPSCSQTIPRRCCTPRPSELNAVHVKGPHAASERQHADDCQWKRSRVMRNGTLNLDRHEHVFYLQVFYLQRAPCLGRPLQGVAGEFTPLLEPMRRPQKEAVSLTVPAMSVVPMIIMK